MKSKLTAVLMAFLLLFTAVPAQVKVQAATQFSDVHNHWAKNEIKYLSERHIIGGYPDGTFKPNEPITRAQASAMLIKALNIPLSENTSVQFKDVSKNSPYYQILATVNEKGVLRGDNGYMRPGEQTSRAQMAAILRRAFELPLDKQATFIDVTPAHWAYQDINGIAKQRIAGGSHGKYMPSNSVTRAQFSAFLVRALDDKMKLSKYRTYVSTKGKIVEQDGYSYFTELAKDDNYFYQVVKENKTTGNREVLLKTTEISKSAWDTDSVSY
ncbi:S-layer homology domain-containing protein [Sporosarcina sp. 179-K 3D1 HS]|uniref:S-layer homology domain-containing protein n=1 Tax=Sporosarcina sp. 179-K 3D1 HS TaxID=3232169 RepID=UPI0039A3D9A8